MQLESCPANIIHILAQGEQSLLLQILARVLVIKMSQLNAGFLRSSSPFLNPLIKEGSEIWYGTQFYLDSIGKIASQTIEGRGINF